MDDMLKDFVVEALDLATNVEALLLSLERNPEDMDTLNAVFRSFHTIKGGAGFMGLPAMVSACHLTENLFDALRTCQIPVTPLAIESALQASGFVEDQLTKLANGTAPDNLPAMPEILEKILTDAIEGNAAVNPAHAADTNNRSEGGVDWAALYRAIVPGGDEIAVPVAQAVPAAANSWDGAERRGENSKETKITAPVKEDSIRVDAIKLDALLEVAGESMQAANQASVLLEKLLQYKFEDAASGLMEKLAETLGRASRYSAELQRATLATRMQPVGRLFQKFPRLVRELAKELGKEVDLNIEGAETEVDRVVVDSLYDPLVHMLRNSLDHGIELPAERTAAGKPAKSVISLKAWQEANSVIIELADDGKGMNPQVLREKAIAKGLIHESAAQTDEAAFQLVFLPGFSTKEVASSVSGRGVGMDVVKTAVEKHRGTIYIDSALGRGTRFSIRLPIELSIVPTMLVSTADAVLGMPMGIVERVVELPESFMAVAGAPVFYDQGRPLPVFSLAGVLGYVPGEERVGVVIAAPQPYILAVGAVDGTADLVIKPLTALAVTGITGTAHSAEGKLVLIVGLTFLLEGCAGGVGMAGA
ncbi:chemotaxis protein CheA [Sulfuriferula sp. AH1]|uniref:chemotaxis protein CheA n=1 Tax=Sulfuriferula sp. AH1 TaxID=1985873 RepID=UPI000B3B15BA|nr:chemotaxis protein CheA [Sulfuriferula sp. AH1]ARU31276.1 chemotaxis protein CheA [Sulfuriferula sp. AH1]